MDEINKAYTEYYEYMNNFIKSTYNIIEQDKKIIEQLNKEKDEMNKGIEQLNKEKDKMAKDKDKMNKEIQELTKKNILLLEKENESTNLILKLDKTIADLRNELRKTKNI
jgi:chromosome segregation ATPase